MRLARPHLAGRFETVADSAHGLEIAGMAGIPLDFFPQAPDKNINRARGHKGTFLPHRAQTLRGWRFTEILGRDSLRRVHRWRLSHLKYSIHRSNDALAQKAPVRIEVITSPKLILTSSGCRFASCLLGTLSSASTNSRRFQSHPSPRRGRSVYSESHKFWFSRTPEHIRQPAAPIKHRCGMPKPGSGCCDFLI